MKDIKKLAETLQDNEIIVLKSFITSGTDRIRQIKGLKPIEFLRAGMWLENKGLIKTTKTKKKFVTLDTLGQRYVKATLPELKLLAVLNKGDKTLEELSKYFSSDELKFAVGYLKKRGAIQIDKGKVSITSYGKSTRITLEGKLLLELGQKGEMKLDDLPPQDLHAYLELKKRKQIVKEIEKQEITFKITELGKKVAKVIPTDKRIGLITSAVIKSEEWKTCKFRRYDVEAPVPKIYPGKKQPYLAFLDEVRAKLVELGFKEMTGPLIETEFWNFDALFQPQNHPAREWTDTYTLKYPKLGDLPNQKLVEAVKKSHEGSWLYKWNYEKAKQLVPRAHGTCLSARWLASGCPDGKYFAIARCYRPDVFDATHLIEFNQLEGIVVGDNLNFKHLLGLFKQFTDKLMPGAKLKFLPDYYPFTEASAVGNIYFPQLKKWVEVFPGGIFRPELTKALGCKKTVLAWGIGIDRIAMYKLGIKDIRYLFSTDLEWLRGGRVV